MDEEGQIRAHIIGQLLGFDFSESQHVKAILDDPQQIHDRALMYLAEYFQGMSEQAPVVIFLEDIHWADDSSLDMLNRLARGYQSSVCCSCVWHGTGCMNAARIGVRDWRTIAAWNCSR